MAGTTPVLSTRSFLFCYVGAVWSARGPCGLLVRFSTSSRSTNKFVVELWGLRDRLVLCYNMNISCLIVEIDAKVVVDVLKNLDYVNHVISSILGDCGQLVSRIQRIQFNHCYRQAN